MIQDRSRKVQNVLDLVEQFSLLCLPVISPHLCALIVAVTSNRRRVDLLQEILSKLLGTPIPPPVEGAL
jgi:hypothetical protein